MNRQSNKITALYCRVGGGEYSPTDLEAIRFQQDSLVKYAIENGMNSIRVFSDCGYSGANFDRPEFQRMLREIKAGNVTNLVVLDMSRLSRDYMSGSLFIEETLPKYGVLFHSVNDGPYVSLKPLLTALRAERGRA